MGVRGEGLKECEEGGGKEGMVSRCGEEGVVRRGGEKGW